MPLIKLDDLNQDLEDQPVPNGKYDLRIAKAEYKETKKGGDYMLALMLRIEGEVGIGTKPCNLMIMDPNFAKDAAAQRMRLRDVKRFIQAFAVPVGQEGFDLETAAEQVTGLTASGVTLTQEEYEGEINNRVHLPKAA